jgi:hypothetical protein
MTIADSFITLARADFLQLAHAMARQATEG